LISLNYLYGIYLRKIARASDRRHLVYRSYRKY